MNSVPGPLAANSIYHSTVSTDTHTTVDEVEGAAPHVVCHLETISDERFVRRVTVGGYILLSVCRQLELVH